MGSHMNEHDFNHRLICRRCGVSEEYGEGQTCYERRPQPPDSTIDSEVDKILDDWYMKPKAQLAQSITEKIAQEANKARIELALKFIEKLDEANVPNEVKIPELVGDDLTRVSVPVVSGEYWVNIHKALKYMRETTQAALTADKEQA